MGFGSGRARERIAIPARAGRAWPLAQVRRELFVRLSQAVAILLIRLDTPLQPLDRLVPSCQAPEVVDGTVGVIAVLALQGQDLILEARILGTQRLAQTLRFLPSRMRNDRATGTEDGSDGRQENQPPDRDTAVGTNHPFRLLSGTIVRRTSLTPASFPLVREGRGEGYRPLST